MRLMSSLLCKTRVHLIIEEKTAKKAYDCVMALLSYSLLIKDNINVNNKYNYAVYEYEGPAEDSDVSTNTY